GKRVGEGGGVELEERGSAEVGLAEAMPEVEVAFEEIDIDEPLVGIIMGSKNDKPKLQPAGEALHEAGIRYEVRVMSAHRDPEKVRDYCLNARMRGLKVIIAGAGMSAALPHRGRPDRGRGGRAGGGGPPCAPGRTAIPPAAARRWRSQARDRPQTRLGGGVRLPREKRGSAGHATA